MRNDVIDSRWETAGEEKRIWEIIANEVRQVKGRKSVQSCALMSRKGRQVR